MELDEEEGAGDGSAVAVGWEEQWKEEEERTKGVQ